MRKAGVPVETHQNETLHGFNFFVNETLLVADILDPILNPHLQPLDQVSFIINGIFLPIIVVFGVISNIFSAVRPPSPFTLPRLLAITDTIVLILLSWISFPPVIGLSPSYYIPSTLYTQPILQGFQVMSTYLLLIFIATRFLSMIETVEYGCVKPTVSAIFISLTFFIPSMFERTIQEFPGDELASLANLTSLAADQLNSTQLVVRRTELFSDQSYNNIFSLLYKFLVLQVVPVWTLVIVSVSSIKRSKINKRRRKSIDALPAILSGLFLVTNITELGVFCVRILLYSPPVVLLRSSGLAFGILYAAKPTVYMLADKSTPGCGGRGGEAIRIPTEDY